MRYYNKQNYNGVTTINGDERDRQTEQLLEGRQQPAAVVRDNGRRVPDGPVDGIRVDGSLPGAVRSAHVDRCRAAELPRDVRDDDLAAVRGVRMEGRAELHDHAGRQARVLQRRTSRSSPTTARPSAASTARCPRSTRVVQHVAAVGRRALPGAAVLVGLRSVRQGTEHSADEHLRREGRAGGDDCRSRSSPTPCSSDRCGSRAAPRSTSTSTTSTSRTTTRRRPTRSPAIRCTS